MSSQISKPSVAKVEFTKSNLVTFGLVLGAIAFAFAQSISSLVERWNIDPQYSHGFLVPLFSIYLAWTWRDSLPAPSTSGRWPGFLLILAGLGLRSLGAYLNFEFAEDVSLIVAIVGAVLLVFGPAVLRWSAAPLAFLVLMVPMPYAVSTFARRPLRRFGTEASTYMLQVFGLAAFSRGNVIELANGSTVGVAEACSGLRMLMIFVALSVAMALLSTRPLWERAVLLLSSLPIALMANIIRIVMTAMGYYWFTDELTRERLHDLAGYAMMPVGLLLLSIESWILSNLLIIEQVKPLSPAALGGSNRIPRLS